MLHDGSLESKRRNAAAFAEPSFIAAWPWGVFVRMMYGARFPIFVDQHESAVIAIPFSDD